MNIENIPQRRTEFKTPENSEQDLQREVARRLGIDQESLKNSPDSLAKEVSQRLGGEIRDAQGTIEEIQKQINDPEIPFSDQEREQITGEISHIREELGNTENQFQSELKDVLEGDTNRREILGIAQRLIDQRLRLENLPEKNLTEINGEELENLFRQRPDIEDVYKEAEGIYRKREERRRKEEEYKERTYRQAQEEKEKFKKLQKDLSSIKAGQIFENYEQDPRFQLIMQEMKVDWIERQGRLGKLPDFLSVEGQEFLYGRQERPYDLSLKEKALERFKKENPDLWERYEEIERTRIYDSPRDDPAVKEVERRILEITNRKVEREGKPWSDVNLNTSLHQWRGFIIMYPEKAQAYADRIPELSRMKDRIEEVLKQKREREKQPIPEPEEIEKPNFPEATQRLITVLETARVEFNLTEEGELKIIEIKREPDPEPQVVVYRGINDPESVLKQSPYAMRVIGPDGRVTINENLEPYVKELSQNPSYENLFKVYEHINEYYNGILNDESVNEEVKKRIREEKRRLAEELREIENDILKGEPLSKILIFRQICHNGGIMEGDLTPYLSASRNPEEAASYGSYLLILSLPPDQITATNPQSKETMIKGNLSLENVAGIVVIPREVKNLSNLDEISRGIIERLGINQITNTENIIEEERKNWEQNINRD